MSAPSELLAVQRRFKTLILSPDKQDSSSADLNWLAPPRAEQGAEIYAEAYGLRMSQELAMRFPCCQNLLSERFTSLARDYLNQTASLSPLLQLFGQAFPAFLAQALPAEPWLGELARYEWAHFETLHRQEAIAGTFLPLDQVLNQADHQAQNPSLNQGSFVLKLNPTLYLQLSDWLLDADTLSKKPTQQVVALLIWKHAGCLYHESRPVAAYHLLKALQSGQSLERACETHGLTPEQLHQWFSDWGRKGVILGFAPASIPVSQASDT